MVYQQKYIIMKKGVVIVVGAVLTLSSCGTYAGSGAFTGGSLGAILGSAIGGIAGGPRGSDLGTIIGMAGGAAVGAAVGAEADQKTQRDVHEHYERVQARKAQDRMRANDGVRYDDVQSDRVNRNWEDYGVDETNSGDDRLYDFQSSDYTDNYSTLEPTTKLPATSSVEELASSYSYDANIEIVNARFIDDDRNGTLGRGETGKIIFEIFNRSNKPVFDVQPCVVEAEGNRHIYISPSIHVERIAPGKGIRYTAMVKADNKIKDGKALFCLSVLQGTKKISKVTEFTVLTKK